MSEKRKPGELVQAVQEYLRAHDGQGTTQAVQAFVNEKFGRVPTSSVRSCLQNTRYFERTGRGEFRLRTE